MHLGITNACLEWPGRHRKIHHTFAQDRSPLATVLQMHVLYERTHYSVASRALLSGSRYSQGLIMATIVGNPTPRNVAEMHDHGRYNGGATAPAAAVAAVRYG